MAEIQIEGTNLGYTEKPYDFKNDAGEQIAGVSQRLHVLVGTEVIEVKVPDAYVAEAKALALHDQVVVLVSLPKTVKPTLLSVA